MAIMCLKKQKQTIEVLTVICVAAETRRNEIQNIVQGSRVNAQVRSFSRRLLSSVSRYLAPRETGPGLCLFLGSNSPCLSGNRTSDKCPDLATYAPVPPGSLSADGGAVLHVCE
jgi:hypothetical protein